MTYILKNIKGEEGNYSHRVALDDNAIDFQSGGGAVDGYVDVESFAGEINYNDSFTLFANWADSNLTLFKYGSDFADYITVQKSTINKKEIFVIFYKDINNRVTWKLPAKQGYDQFLWKHNGGENTDEFYFGGVKLAAELVVNQGTPQIAASQQLLVGGWGQTSAADGWGIVRKFQILSAMPDGQLIREIFNYGTCEGRGNLSNASFILDIDFNKTGTDAPTTRASTPAYTISNVGTIAYQLFYT